MTRHVHPRQFLRHMYPENPEGTQVIVGSIKIGYDIIISDTILLDAAEGNDFEVPSLMVLLRFR